MLDKNLTLSPHKSKPKSMMFSDGVSVMKASYINNLNDKKPQQRLVDWYLMALCQ